MMALQIILFIFGIGMAAAMSAADWRHRLIPDVFLFPFLLAGLLLSAHGALPWVGIEESAIAAIIGYGLAFGMNILFKLKTQNSKLKTDPIGMGDIKLLAAGGIWLGVTGLSIALVVACALGYIWGLRAKQKFVPFAPFFFAGAGAAIVFLLI